MKEKRDFFNSGTLIFATTLTLSCIITHIKILQLLHNKWQGCLWIDLIYKINNDQPWFILGPAKIVLI